MCVGWGGVLSRLHCFHILISLCQRVGLWEWMTKEERWELQNEHFIRESEDLCGRSHGDLPQSPILARYTSPLSVSGWLPMAHTCLLCQRIIFSRCKPPAWKYISGGYALLEGNLKVANDWWTQDTNVSLSLRKKGALVPFTFNTPLGDLDEAQLQQKICS